MAGVDAILPRKTRFGLLDSIPSLPTEISENEWRSGLTFESLSCKTVNRWYHDSCDGRVTPPENALKVLNSNTITSTFRPFPTYVFDGCQSGDFLEAVYTKHTKLLLDGGISHEFAKELATGEYSGSPSFTSVAVPVTSTAVTITEALSRLKRARAEAGVIGGAIFHAHEALAPYFQELTVERPDGLYLIGTNDIIIFDRYPTYTPETADEEGTEPVVPDPDETYITITGQVEYKLGKVNVNAGRKELQNRLYVRAEQQGIFRFDPCGVYAALVALPEIPTSVESS